MFQEFSDAISAGDISLIVTSTVGQIITWVITFLLMAAIFFIASKAEKKSYGAKAVAYSGAAIAIGAVLSYVTPYTFPQGGSVTLFSMLAITTIGYIYGLRYGLIAGFAYGLLQLILKPYVVHPLQLFLDYPIAFAMLGLSGLFSNQKYGLPIGYTVAIFGRFVIHVISGVVFFAAYAPEGQHPIIYSMIYNGTYIGAEGIVTIILLVLVLSPVFTGLKKQALMA